MGTRVAPNFAIVYVGRLVVDKFVYQIEWENRLIICIDDIILIWKGDKDSLINRI